MVKGISTGIEIQAHTAMRTAINAVLILFAVLLFVIIIFSVYYCFGSPGNIYYIAKKITRLKNHGGCALKRILVKSVFDAFDYVMEHYYPAGMEEFAERTDSYAVISIQDSHTEGFGFRFFPSSSCRDVLTLLFDDIDRPVEGAVMFSEDQADQIISFIERNIDVETLLVHCYGGQSRSLAVGIFAAEMTGIGDEQYFTHGRNPNSQVLELLRAKYRGK